MLHSPWLSWGGAYVPSLFQHLLNHTSISGEGPNWRNMLKILCQFAYERKSVHAEFFFTELAFVLAKFSLLRLNEKERNFPYVFVKKAEDK